MLQDLADAFHGVASPFACGGSIRLDEPVALEFPDGGVVTVEPGEGRRFRSDDNAELIARCSPARFGQGRRTRYDRKVRDALQLNAEGGAFSVRHFDPARDGVLEQVRRQLAPGVRDLTAELYSLNIYQSRGHFEPHKDTPRGPDMVGTLVVCLPSRFRQGQLVLVHHGAVRAFDWGTQIDQDPDPHIIRWAAFYGDVDHSITRLWWGSRVTLSYILRAGATPALESVSTPENEGAIVLQRLRAALASKRFMPKGGVVAAPCTHMYSQHEPWQRRRKAKVTKRSANTLKGRDRALARAALELGLDVELHPYLVEACADETWRLRRYPTRAEQKGLGAQVDPFSLRDALPLAEDEPIDPYDDLTWLQPPPGFNQSPSLYRWSWQDAGPIHPDLAPVERFHQCEYSGTGYFGNEGAETGFYLYAALHIAIPPVGEGVRV